MTPAHRHNARRMARVAFLPAIEQWPDPDSVLTGHCLAGSGAVFAVARIPATRFLRAGGGHHNGLDGQADVNPGATAGPGRDGKLATEFRLDQGPDDLQAQAGMIVEAEPGRQARPVVLHAYAEPPGPR